MHIQDLFRRFADQQTTKIAEAQESLGRGGASSWDDYHKRVGHLNGRRAAVEELEALVKEIMLRDDEDFDDDA